MERHRTELEAKTGELRSVELRLKEAEEREEELLDDANKKEEEYSYCL